MHFLQYASLCRNRQKTLVHITQITHNLQGKSGGKLLFLYEKYKFAVLYLFSYSAFITTVLYITGN